MNDVKIGKIDFNTSCGCDSSKYPYGVGRYHKQSTDELTDITVIIANDSDEGKELEQMLKEKVEAGKIKEYIFTLILKNKSVSELKEIIKIKLDQKYIEGLRAGKAEKQQEIKKVLGLY